MRKNMQLISVSTSLYAADIAYFLITKHRLAVVSL